MELSRCTEHAGFSVMRSGSLKAQLRWHGAIAVRGDTTNNDSMNHAWFWGQLPDSTNSCMCPHEPLVGKFTCRLEDQPNCDKRVCNDLPSGEAQSRHVWICMTRYLSAKDEDTSRSLRTRDEAGHLWRECLALGLLCPEFDNINPPTTSCSTFYSTA